MKSKVFAVSFVVCLTVFLCGCASSQASPATNVVRVDASSIVSASSESPSSGLDALANSSSASSASASASSASASSSAAAQDSKALAKQLLKELDVEDMTDEYRDLFEHGDKGAKYQKYIVLHDTEGDSDPADVVHYWGGGEGVAAHFVVGKDGSVVQCVDLDQIAHHAGFGDTGHNELFDVEDESRDDKVGTEPIGDWASDYGMNSYSVGIEMVHVGGEGDYPEEQLEAVDKLIAYIDAYYGKESEIIDHKAWRSGNSDTSEEFSEYFENYQDHRTHD